MIAIIIMMNYGFIGLAVLVSFLLEINKLRQYSVVAFSPGKLTNIDSLL